MDLAVALRRELEAAMAGGVMRRDTLRIDGDLPHGV